MFYLQTSTFFLLPENYNNDININNYILEYLDSSIKIAIDIKNIDFLSTEISEKSIIPLPRNIKRKFKSEIRKDNIFTRLCKKLNLIYLLIKNKDFQNIVYNYIINQNNYIEEEFFLKNNKDVLFNRKSLLDEFLKKYGYNNYKINDKNQEDSLTFDVKTLILNKNYSNHIFNI